MATVIDPEDAIDAGGVVAGVNAWLATALDQIDQDVRLGHLSKLSAESYLALKDRMPAEMQQKTGIRLAMAFLARESEVIESDAWQEIVFADGTGQTDAQVRAKVDAAKAAIRAAMGQ
jgi:hypothetical protein